MKPLVSYSTHPSVLNSQIKVLKGAGYQATTHNQRCWLTSHHTPLLKGAGSQATTHFRKFSTLTANFSTKDVEKCERPCFAQTKQGRRETKVRKRTKNESIVTTLVLLCRWTRARADNEWKRKTGKREQGVLILFILYLTGCIPLMQTRLFVLFCSCLHRQPLPSGREPRRRIKHKCRGGARSWLECCPTSAGPWLQITHFPL